MENPFILATFMLFAGLVSMSGGIFNWNWFMENRRARLIVRVAGRSGARVFYTGLGLIFTCISLVMLFNAFFAA